LDWEKAWLDEERSLRLVESVNGLVGEDLGNLWAQMKEGRRARKRKDMGRKKTEREMIEMKNTDTKTQGRERRGRTKTKGERDRERKRKRVERLYLASARTLLLALFCEAISLFAQRVS
jgi:hypothetical protein